MWSSFICRINYGPQKQYALKRLPSIYSEPATANMQKHGPQFHPPVGSNVAASSSDISQTSNARNPHIFSSPPSSAVNRVSSRPNAIVTEPDLGFRGRSSSTTVPDQLESHQRQSPQPQKSLGNLPALPSQPVVVRSYTPAMASPTSSRSPFRSSPSTKPPVPFPSPSDFAISSIVSSIEPDVCGTLDAIAEICGRSRLSLANEYGSHLPPLGEIRAGKRWSHSRIGLAEHTLKPVQEATASKERLALQEDGQPVGDEEEGSPIEKTKRAEDAYTALQHLMRPSSANENVEAGTDALVSSRTERRPVANISKEKCEPSDASTRICVPSLRRNCPNPQVHSLAETNSGSVVAVTQKADAVGQLISPSDVVDSSGAELSGQMFALTQLKSILQRHLSARESCQDENDCGDGDESSHLSENTSKIAVALTQILTYLRLLE